MRIVRWTKQWKLARDHVVWINIAKINASWRSERGYYIGRNGRSKVAMWGRYYRVGEWVASGRKMWMPHISLDDRGRVSFTDGRHRFAWMRDHSVRSMPITVDRDQARAVAKRFGTKSRICRVPAFVVRNFRRTRASGA